MAPATSSSGTTDPMTWSIRAHPKRDGGKVSCTSFSMERNSRANGFWFVEAAIPNSGTSLKFATITQPMLATLSEKPFDNDDWLFELKLDGIRAIAVKNGAKLDLWTRNAKTLTHRFPTLAKAFDDLPVDTVVLDGEIVALDEK